MRRNDANLNQYSEKLKNFPDEELLILRDAVLYLLLDRRLSTMKLYNSKNLSKVRFKEYVKKFQELPNTELVSLKDAVEYELTYLRNFQFDTSTSKKQNNTENKYDAVFTGPGNFNLECKKEDIDKKALDIWNKSSLYTNISDTYADFLKYVVIKFSNGKQEYLIDYVSQLL